MPYALFGVSLLLIPRSLRLACFFCHYSLIFLKLCTWICLHFSLGIWILSCSIMSEIHACCNTAVICSFLLVVESSQLVATAKPHLPARWWPVSLIPDWKVPGEGNASRLIFFTHEIHGQRSLVDQKSTGLQRSDMTQWLNNRRINPPLWLLPCQR